MEDEEQGGTGRICSHVAAVHRHVNISMVNAGVKTGKETITLGRFERTPTELVLAMAVCSAAAAVGICVESGIASICVNQYRNYTFVSENIQYIAFLVPVACLYSVALFFFNNIVAKVKAGTFWQTA